MDTIKEHFTSKGLSRLQKFILYAASKGGGNITNQRVLIEYYGFQTSYGYLTRGHGSKAFDVGQIGKHRYNAASVAVVKSFDRLAARGLARREYNHGIYLTDTGRAVAESIHQMLKNVEAAPS
jgi:hypothetical protein